MIKGIEARLGRVERKWWILAVVAGATFMSAVDGSVVNLALPAIGRATGASVSTLAWVPLIYLLTASSLLLTFGRLADLYGPNRLYRSGLVVFWVGSLLCGLSRGVGVLIAFRAVQAVGAGIIFAVGPGVLTRAFGSHERGRALGFQATATYVGLSIGPVLGGICTQSLGWPFIFFINVPIGIPAILLAFRAFHKDEPGPRQPFDLVGALSMAGSLACLLFALNSGSKMGWRHPLIGGLFGLAVLGACLFVRSERRVQAPLLDLALFKSWTFSSSTMAAFLNYVAAAGVGFLLPFYLVRANGYPEAKAGLVMMATPVAMALLAGASGAWSDRIGPRFPATLGLAVNAVGILCLRILHVGAKAWTIVACLGLIGIGAGLFTTPNNSAIMGAAPKGRQGVAGAILAAARNIGFCLGVAFASLVYTWKTESLAVSIPQNEAIVLAIRSSVSLVFCIMIPGIALSAFRGRGPDSGP